MTDSNRLDLTRVLQVLVPIIGVGIAVVSLLVAIASRKKELSCVYLGSDKVVSLESGGVDPELKVEFKSKTISSLVKMKFAVRNSGSVAIMREDIKEPLRLVFPKEVQLLSSIVEKTSPSPFVFSTALDLANNSVNCDFLLLNSADEALISVFAYNSEPVKALLVGRVVDVRKISNVDNTLTTNLNPFPFTSNRSVRVVIYWSLFGFNIAVAVLLVFLLILLIRDQFRYHSWEKVWGAAYTKVEVEAAASYKAGKPVTLRDLLSAKSIPKKPNAPFDNWKEFCVVNLVFLTLIILSSLTALFIFRSPSS